MFFKFIFDFLFSPETSIVLFVCKREKLFMVFLKKPCFTYINNFCHCQPQFWRISQLHRLFTIIFYSMKFQRFIYIHNIVNHMSILGRRILLYSFSQYKNRKDRNNLWWRHLLAINSTIQDYLLIYSAVIYAIKREL